MENLSARSSSYRARSSILLSDPMIGQRLAAFMVLLALALPLGGCGFTPLYAERDNASITADLSMLDVSAPNDRLGRELKYGLLDLLSSAGNPPSNPTYLVEIAPIVYSEDLAIERDADVTRKNMVMVVPFRLVDTTTKETVLRSTARSRSSYNRVDSEFANIVAAQDAERRIAAAIAHDIKVQLSIHFHRLSQTGG